MQIKSLRIKSYRSWPVTATSDKIRNTAIAEAKERFDYEIARMESLQNVNPSVRENEVAALRQSRERLLSGLEQTELSLDAIRVVVFT